MFVSVTFLCSNDFANIGVIEASRARFYKEKGKRRGFIWLPLYVFVCLRSNKETSRDINSKFSISPTVACYRGYIYMYMYT